jgi:uncharacterized protein
MRLHVSLVAVLLVAGANVLAAQDSSEFVFKAIRNDQTAELKSLITKSGAATKDKHGTTPLMYAAAYGSLDSMKLLIDAGADGNTHNDFDATALMWAAGDPAKARLLIDHGANVNAVSKLKRTPLMLAATHDGASETVKLLLSKGADPQAADVQGDTALLLAADAGDVESVRLLVASGAKIDTAGEFGDTPLIRAVGVGNVEIAKLLLQKGANVNAVEAPPSVKVKNGTIAL